MTSAMHQDLLVDICDKVNVSIMLYVDGVLNGSNTVSGGLQSTLFPASIGSRTLTQSDPYNLNSVGTIDEVAIYNYVLSASEAQLHYRAGTNGPVSLTSNPSGGNWVLSRPLGTLQSASVVNGSYTNVPGAVSPLTNSISSTMQFYRVKVK